MAGNVEQCARRKRALRLRDSVAHVRAGHGVEFIVHPQQHDTGVAIAGGEKELREIQVLREDDMAALPCPAQQLGVRRIAWADLAPVLRLPTAGHQQRHPIRAEIHIHQQLHAAVMASSSSSTRRAA